MARHSLSLPETEPILESIGSIFFVGTATAIIRHNGFTILTDTTSFTRAIMQTWVMASHPSA